jgi:hypothetical protein
MTKWLKIAQSAKYVGTVSNRIRHWTVLRQRSGLVVFHKNITLQHYITLQKHYEKYCPLDFVRNRYLNITKFGNMDGSKSYDRPIKTAADRVTLVSCVMFNWNLPKQKLFLCEVFYLDCSVFKTLRCEVTTISYKNYTFKFLVTKLCT